MRIASYSACALLMAGLLYSPDVSAQIVQLPTFQVFSVSTTVLVPDRGSMMLGGVDRASFGSSSFGVPGLGGIPGAGRLFGNRAIGSEMGTSRLNATATIINHDEWDRALLSEAAARRGQPATDPAVSRKAAFLAQNMGSSRSLVSPHRTLIPSTNPRTTVPLPRSLVIRDTEAEALEAFRLAQDAELRGQLSAARINYQRASSLGTGSLRAQSLARLAAITKQMHTSEPRRAKR